jgi:Mlc titration factor MtfA (ptsG expression regulator)
LRAERDRTFSWVASGALLTCTTLLGAALGGAPGALEGGIAGLVAAIALARVSGRRDEGRRRALRQPFPESARTYLREHYDHYDRLPSEWRVRFEDDVRLFLAQTRMTGVEVEVTEELRLLVAASAVTLSLGWRDYEWAQLTDVLLYPDSFDRDYRFGGDDRVGEAHPWGTVILSVPSLLESFEDPDDGFHVGLHEFAHLLTLEGTGIEGIPGGLRPERRREWVLLAEKEMERLRRGKSVLDTYGSDDPREFLGVAVEAFFEIPLAVRRRHRELYAILAEYFAQDPAAWDDERGLTLS